MLKHNVPQDSSFWEYLIRPKHAAALGKVMFVDVVYAFCVSAPSFRRLPDGLFMWVVLFRTASSQHTLQLPQNNQYFSFFKLQARLSSGWKILGVCLPRAEKKSERFLLSLVGLLLRLQPLGNW